MQKWMCAIGAMVLAASAHAGETAEAPAKAANTAAVVAKAAPQAQLGRHPHIAAELLEMVKVDQEVRERLTSSNYSEAVRAEVMALDAIHEPRIVAILAEIGWPGVDGVGPQANQAMWLLVQHASPQLIKQSLPAMKAAPQKGELPWSTVALSIDRDLINDGKKQRYGSQLSQNAAGKLELRPVEDESRLDERRASVGLEPIAAYLRRFEAP